MASNAKNGKALEYALLESFNIGLQELNCSCSVVASPQLTTAKGYFEAFSGQDRDRFLRASAEAFRHISSIEPLLTDGSKISLSLASDDLGIAADVRDVIVSKQDGWEIGISVKNNHDALKHTRLSKNDNFAQKWLGLNSSQEYRASIATIFDELALLKARNMKWKDLPNKAERFYMPLLGAFTKELALLMENPANQTGKRLVEYIIGVDYYKFVHRKKGNVILGFNVLDTLNKSVQNQAINKVVPTLPLPTIIQNIYPHIKKGGKRSDNTIVVDFDNGWKLGFRIHSADSFVKTSLKWDIQPLSLPDNLYTYKFVT